MGGGSGEGGGVGGGLCWIKDNCRRKSLHTYCIEKSEDASFNRSLSSFLLSTSSASRCLPYHQGFNWTLMGSQREREREEEIS